MPSSFTQTGHIAHVNLREEWLPYKHVIGEVIIDVGALRVFADRLESAVDPHCGEQIERDSRSVPFLRHGSHRGREGLYHHHREHSMRHH